MINSYFDASDYNMPVKQYIDNQIYDYLNFGIGKEYMVYVSENKADTKDSHFTLFDGENQYEYLSIDSVSRFFSTSDGTLLMF